LPFRLGLRCDDLATTITVLALIAPLVLAITHVLASVHLTIAIDVGVPAAASSWPAAYATDTIL
jgi:hypothetical protein